MRFHRHRRFLDNLLPAACRCAVVSGLIVAPLLGQTGPVTRPPRGFPPNGFFTFDKLEAISKTDAHLTYTIPITRMPPGRAGFAPSLSLIYNTNIVDYYLWLDQAVSGGPPPPTMVVQQPKQSDWGGWRYSSSFSYALDEEEKPLDWTCDTPDATYRYRLNLITPDGAHHVLSLHGQQADSDGYFQYDSGGHNPCQVGGGGDLPGPLYYFTTDGSYYRVKIELPSGNATVYQPDGVRVEFAGAQPYAVYDRNGNRATLTNSTDSRDPCNPEPGPCTVYTTAIEDDFGRRITIDRKPSYGYHGITQEGFGETLHWKVNWTSSLISVNYTTIDNEETATWDQPNVSSIEIPATSPLSYLFTYRGSAPGQARLQTVTLPLGGSTTYTYGCGQGADCNNPGVSQKVVSWMDGTIPRNETTTYSVLHYSQCQSVLDCTVITNPDQGAETIYYLNGSGPVWKRGLVLKDRKPSWDMTEFHWHRNTPAGWASGSRNAYIAMEVHSVGSGAAQKAAVTLNQVDRNGNQVTRREYDWVSYSSVPHDSYGEATEFTPATLFRTTTNHYTVTTPTADLSGESDPFGDDENVSESEIGAYWRPDAPSMRSLVDGTVIDGAGMGAVSRFQYDTRGNLTYKWHWDSDKQASKPAWNALNSGNSAQILRDYDDYGNLTQVTDAGGIVTHNEYDEGSLYLASTTVAYGLAEARAITYDARDFATGLVTQQHDDTRLASQSPSTPGLITLFDYDKLGRPTLVNEGGERYTRTYYDDAARRIVVRTGVNGADDGLAGWAQIYDQLGRVCLNRQLDADSDDADVDTTGIKVQTRYWDGGEGKYMLVSNPFRSDTEATMGWTRTRYDQDGRMVEVATFGGSDPPYPWGSNSSNTGTTGTSYTAETATVTDAAGAWRTSSVDGAGRLVSVAEPVYGATTYTYDSLDNLTGVDQGERDRSFTYSSLKRLRTATNPESGTITYTYYDSGNLATRLDARGVLTSHTYDGLNRMLTKTYNDGTPNVTWTWDTQRRGRLTGVDNGVSQTSFDGYDVLGRPASSRQETGPSDLPFQYTYVPAGVNSVTYPSGRKVSYTYDRAGRTNAVKQGEPGTGTPYATMNAYAPHGALSQMTLRNGIVETTTFNTRLQPVSIAAGADLTMAFGYNPVEAGYPSGNPAKNNGNVVSVGVSGAGGTYSQTFTYDALNRLRTAVEAPTPGHTGWTQNYLYDRYGNRALYGAADQYIPGGVLTPQVSGNPTDLTSAASLVQAIYPSRNQWNGVTYDDGTPSAGDITTMASYALQYDAENRLKSSTLNNATTLYLYDGEGRRVQKVTCPVGLTQCTAATQGATSSVYAYDSAGDLAAEYENNVTNPEPPLCTTCYLTADHLGSARMVTNETGTLRALHDYLPFGEEIEAGTNGRGDLYGLVVPKQKFTGKERDAETGLDYFGARYLSSAQGRFSSADPSPLSLTVTDPQSWNLYSYVRNRPLRFVDVGGRWPTATHGTILGAALDGYVSAGELAALTREQYRMDSDQSAKNQYRHAMSGGEKPEVALTNMWSWVGDNIGTASRDLGPGGEFTPASLVALGDAIHTVQDYTCPEHTDANFMPRVWNGGFWPPSKWGPGLQHMNGESTTYNPHWAGIGFAIRLTMAAFLQANPVLAAKRGLTDATFESEVKKRIAGYVEREFSMSIPSNYRGQSHWQEDAARQCALGNPAACF